MGLDCMSTHMLTTVMMSFTQESGCPLKTMIEVIVRYLLEKSRRVSSLSAVQSPHPSTTRYHIYSIVHVTLFISVSTKQGGCVFAS